MGVISGDMLIDGHPRDDSFQRKTGYVQQQDLHLETSTVRESLTFSALLRQPKTTPKAEKIAYVEEVINVSPLALSSRRNLTYFFSSMNLQGR